MKPAAAIHEHARDEMDISKKLRAKDEGKSEAQNPIVFTPRRLQIDRREKVGAGDSPARIEFRWQIKVSV
jgi:hypothetical protein